MSAVSVDAAMAAIQAAAAPPQATRVPLEQAFGRVLLKPVVATRDQPPFDAAAMDGYAVTATMAEYQTLTVIGESQAGRAFSGRIDAGEAVRVFTGAPLPMGASRVVMQEDVVREAATIGLRPGGVGGSKAHVRPCGSDFRMGEILLQAGDRLDAGKLALAAATGLASVSVARRPNVAVICTGDELVSSGIRPRDDQIFESNAVALKALIRQWGAIPVGGGVKRDDSADLARAIQAAKAQIIVTVGGASVGDYDLVRPALDALGVRWLFEKVDIKPGKPTAFGILGDGRRVLCLPGNPGSALVCAHLFLKPLIMAALGAQVADRVQALPCAAGLPANGSRETFLRAIVLAGADGTPVLLPLSDQDCGRIHPLAITNALIRRRGNALALAAGEVCECVWLNT